MSSVMTTSAPDFAPGYPSKGERIGPGWQTVWDSMLPGQWHKGRDFALQMSGKTGLAPGTVTNLLRAAAKAGHLESELRFSGRVGGYRSNTAAIRSAWYRRP
jgi:hypothetical protein